MTMFKRVDPSYQQVRMSRELEAECRAVEHVMAGVPNGRLKSIAMTHLEAFALFATKAIMHDMQNKDDE